jgi:ABC-type lipoprotein export system ATPase subunit
MKPLCRLRGVGRSHSAKAGIDDGAVSALCAVDLSIDQRELVALIGPSGSGKTTLLNILGLLDRPTEGEYWLDGQSTTTCTASQRALLRQRNIAFAFQAFHLLPQFSALDNVALPLVYRGLDWSAARQCAAQKLEQLGLTAKLDHFPGQLSAGQQQRVGLARALVGGPRLLLADEPTGNLDPATAASTFDLFDQARHTHEMAVVLVTHDHTIARRCDRVVHIDGGQIIHDPAASPC